MAYANFDEMNMTDAIQNPSNADHAETTGSCVVCRSLTFGRHRALMPPLDWTVKPGECWAVTGENGCGKTTLIKTILGFLKPISGSFEAVSPRAYVAQVSEAASTAPARIRDIVAQGLESGLSGLMPFYAWRRRKTIDDALKDFDLTDIQKRDISRVSVGQKQRALLARAFVRRPAVVFLDEATSAMDPTHAKSVFAHLAELCKSSNCAVIAVSHSLATHIESMTHELRFTTDGYEIKTLKNTEQR